MPVLGSRLIADLGPRSNICPRMCCRRSVGVIRFRRRCSGRVRRRLGAEPGFSAGLLACFVGAYVLLSSLPHAVLRIAKIARDPTRCCVVRLNQCLPLIDLRPFGLCQTHCSLQSFNLPRRGPPKGNRNFSFGAFPSPFEPATSGYSTDFGALNEPFGSGRNMKSASSAACPRAARPGP